MLLDKYSEFISRKTFYEVKRSLEFINNRQATIEF